ncbi:MAG TPA: mechanosensitive ion channel family protein [Bacilli bacterium]|nr:mechanosensitive ion channel family protein [Bacilli bacterium]
METVTRLWEELMDKVASVDFWAMIGFAVLKIIVILILARIVLKIADVAIARALSHKAMRMDERRGNTLTKLLINVVRYVVYFLVGLTILNNLGLDVTTLIAGAGVAGLAIGFGAQSLVKDVITGFFIIFEDQFGVGDYVMVNTNNQVVGTVMEVGLRITKVRAYTGEVHIIPNGQINQVTNYSKANSLAVLDLSVAKEEDLGRVYQVLEQVGKQAKEEIDTILEEPAIAGLQMFGASDMVIRMTVECKPMEHYGVMRQMRKMVKEAFDREGIEIPYPKQVNYFMSAELPTEAQQASGQKVAGQA